MADPHSLWHTVREMITARRRLRLLGRSNVEPILDNAGAVLTFRHTAGSDRLDAVHNLSAETQTLTLPDAAPRTIVLTSRAAGAPTLHERTLTLPAYGYLWLGCATDEIRDTSQASEEPGAPRHAAAH